MVSRELGISEHTYYRWREEFGGLRVDQERKLKELGRENAHLKRAVANLPGWSVPKRAHLLCHHPRPELLRGAEAAGAELGAAEAPLCGLWRVLGEDNVPGMNPLRGPPEAHRLRCHLRRASERLVTRAFGRGPVGA